jgi:hypothetical protein
VYSVHDWAEVHRLHHVEGMAKEAIAAKLAMSRTTVHRLLALGEPPRYERTPAGSKLDPFKSAIAALLREDPKVAATVIAARLRPQGFQGSLTVLKDQGVPGSRPRAPLGGGRSESDTVTWNPTSCRPLQVRRMLPPKQSTPAGRLVGMVFPAALLH